MTRLFIDVNSSIDDELIINGDEARYLSGVLRMRVGEEITIVNELHEELCCEIKSFDKSSVKVVVKDKQQNKTEPPYEAVLYQSVSKGERMDYTIQKAVELGVSRIVPVFSERCIVKYEAGKNSKILRWQKIAEEAARQSGRGIVPEVSEPVYFEQGINDSKDGEVKIFAWEEEKESSLKEILHERHAQLGEGNKKPVINIFIGPEGGFTEEEAKLAEDNGFSLVTLGPRILRTESAAPCVLSMLIYEFEL